MEMSKRLLRIVLGDRPIAYHPIFARAMKSAAGGIWLSQILYWDSVKAGDAEEKGIEYDGWFFKTNAELMGETCISVREGREAKKRAQELGVVKTEKRGSPPTTWYFVDLDVLETVLSGTTVPIQAVRHRTIQAVRPHAQIIPQSTTESTTESTFSAPKSGAPRKANDAYLIGKALSDVTGIDFSANRGMLCKTAKVFVSSNGYAVEEIPDIIRKYFGVDSWYYHSTWQGKKGDRPNLSHIRTYWKQWEKPQPKSGVMNILERWGLLDGKSEDHQGDPGEVYIDVSPKPDG